MAEVKRTLSPNVLPIPILDTLRDDNGVPYRYSNVREAHINVYKITVEGSKDNDKKVVIKYHPIKTEGSLISHNDTIVVLLKGSSTRAAWDEFEGDSLLTQFDANLDIDLSNKEQLSAALSETEQKRLQQVRLALNNHLYWYFHEDPNGNDIMEAVRKKNNLIQQKLEKQDVPRYDKIVRESAEKIKAKYHVATIWETGQMFYYKDGRHVFGAERIIEEECFALFQYDAKSFMIEEIKKAIKRQTYHDLSEFDADPNIINVKNGLYHIKEKILTEHTPSYLSLNQKPIIYDPDAKCPEFDRFESGCLYPSQIKTVNQCAAATFYRGSLYEHYVIHVGRGWNGKSKLNNTMEKMHGVENVSHVAFNDISRDPYALSDLDLLRLQQYTALSRTWPFKTAKVTKC